jgi:hypothetical protein
MTNKEFSEYRSGKKCASEYIMELVNIRVYNPDSLTSRQLKQIIKDKIDLSNKLITDNNQVSFNQGYKHTMEDFLHFITK